MSTSRIFINIIGTGTALTTIAISKSSFALSMIADPENKLKPIRVGIIGAENSHTIDFGKMFNIDKKFPGVEVSHL